jgi:hypothetical protein
LTDTPHHISYRLPRDAPELHPIVRQPCGRTLNSTRIKTFSHRQVYLVLLSVISNPLENSRMQIRGASCNRYPIRLLGPFTGLQSLPTQLASEQRVHSTHSRKRVQSFIKPETCVYPRLLRTWGLGRNIYSVTKFLHLRRPYLSSSPLVLCTVRIILTCTFVPFSRSLPIAHASFISPLWLALGANIPLMFVRYQTGDFMFRVTKLPLMTIVHVTDSVPFSVARSI